MRLLLFLVAFSVSQTGAGAEEAETLQKMEQLKEMTKIPDGMFEGCEELQEIEIPETIRRIGANVFQESGLRQIEIPDTVEEIGTGACYWCADLEQAHILGERSELSDFTFTNCFHLTEVELSDEIRAIGEMAFAGCRELERIALPEQLRKIGAYAFLDCSQLRVVYIPESIEEIDETSFDGCRKELVITGAAGSYAERYAKEYGFSFCESGTEEWFADGTLDLGKAEEGAVIDQIPAYVKEKSVRQVAGLWRFQGEELVIPDGVEAVAGSEMTKKNMTVKRIILPESLKKIETNAFWNFDALEEITLPDTVEEIRSFAFQGCKNLKEMTLPKGLDRLSSQSFLYAGLTHVTIPGNIRKCLNSFLLCENLKTVTVEEGVEALWGTFGSCSALESVEIPVSMKQISCSTFRGCGALKEVWIYSRDVDLDYRIDYETFGAVEFYGFGDSTETEEFYYLFADSPDVVLHGYAGSTAEAFARARGLMFEVING